jgi:hypothetical protein
MNIIPKKDKTDHVLESYTFTLKYGKGSETQGPIGLTLSSSLNKHPVTVKSAKSSLYTMMRHLDMLVRTLPDLPGKHLYDMEEERLT